jgi:putative hydrolase of the HAD superfamily
MPTTINSFTEITPVQLGTITVVLLDLDNTLYPYEPCHTTALAAAHALLQSKIGPVGDFAERYAAAQKIVKDRISTTAASHSRILYFQTLLEGLAQNEAIALAPTLEEHYWNTFLTVMRINDGVVNFLVECKNNGTTVGVVSDLTTHIQCQKLVTLGIHGYIDFLVTSEEAGAEKPDARPFLLALKKAHSPAHTALMIGDSLEKDVRGAEALGIHAIHFTPTK